MNTINRCKREVTGGLVGESQHVAGGLMHLMAWAGVQSEDISKI